MIDRELFTRKIVHISGDLEELPRDYYDSFTELGKMGILEPKFASGIARAAGLRNRIVHEYDEIEPEKVFGAIRSALADLPVYLQAVLSFIG